MLCRLTENKRESPKVEKEEGRECGSYISGYCKRMSRLYQSYLYIGIILIFIFGSGMGKTGSWDRLFFFFFFLNWQLTR